MPVRRTRALAGPFYYVRAWIGALRWPGLGWFALACAGPGGEASLLLEPEGTITGGIAAGEGAEEIQDGWSVTFSKYIIAVGPVELRQLEGALRATDPRALAIDLSRLPNQGEPIWRMSGLEQGRYNVFFATEAAGYEQHDSVSDEDFERMVARRATHLISGTLTHPSGFSCPPRALADVPSDAEVVGENAASDSCFRAPSLHFSIEARAEVTFGPCSIDGLPGLVVRGGEITTAAISMHGDHLFFGGFPEGSEGEARRYAQWLADCDLDVDGTISSEELERIPTSALAAFDERFPLGGSPLRPIDDMLAYVESQLSTQGHFEGEGECAVGFDPLDVR